MLRRSTSASTVIPLAPGEPPPTGSHIYEVVDEQVDTGYPELPVEVHEERDRIYALMSTDAAAAIPTLAEWVERFPTVPTVKNWLANCYQAVGRDVEADAVARRMVNDHPDYLFGRLYWADRLMDAGWLDKVPVALGPFDLKQMFPNRTQFHFTEALGLWGVLARYRLLTGEHDLAADHLWDMQQVAPEHAATRAVERLLADAPPPTRPTPRPLKASDIRILEPSPRPRRQGSHTPKKDRNRKGRRRR